MPHFTKAPLEGSLRAHGIEYRHMPELGGLRKPEPDSINAGWRNVSFRGYADHMQTEEFRQGIERLIEITPPLTGEVGAQRRVGPTSSATGHGAVMCAEAVPWRCHRSLLADALTVRGVDVRHIIDKSEPSRHALTAFAWVDDGRITYPAPDTLPI
jgi:uncharacterized protein (DUF488 family)